MSDAVHAFVDGAYLRKRADELGEPWADPARIALQALAADMRNILERPVEVRSLLSRVTYYDALPPQGEPDPEDIDGYCKAIELLPNTHLGFGFLRGKPRRQKGVDTLIAVDMLEGAYLKAYSRALLIAGDADYVPAIQAVQRTGINVVVAAVEDLSLSDDLRRAVDRFVPIGPKTRSNDFPRLMSAGGVTWPVSRRPTS